MPKKEKETSNISVNVNSSLKKFMIADAKRLQLNHTHYIERLIAKRKKDSDPIKSYKI